MAAEVPNDVPVAQKATWTTFLKSIASFSGDLSSLTAPPFILSPVSLAEFPSYWGEPTAQFAVRPLSLPCCAQVGSGSS